MTLPAAAAGEKKSNGAQSEIAKIEKRFVTALFPDSARTPPVTPNRLRAAFRYVVAVRREKI